MADKDKKNSVMEENKKESVLVTKESVSAVCALFCIIALLILFTKNLMFGSLGNALHYFLTGLFGYFAYPLFFSLLYVSIMTLIEKRLVRNRKIGFFVVMSIIFGTLIAHTIQTLYVKDWALDGYIQKCYFAGGDFPMTTIAGFAGGLAVYGLAKFIGGIGAIIVFLLLFAAFIYGTVLAAKGTTLRAILKNRKEAKKALKESMQAQTEQSSEPVQEQAQVSQRPSVSLSGNGSSFSPFGNQTSDAEKELERSYQDSREFLFGANPKENYRRNLIFDPTSNVNNLPAVEPTQPAINSAYTPSYTNAYEESVNEGSTAAPEKILSEYTPYSLSEEPKHDPYVLEPQNENVYEEEPAAYEEPATPQTSDWNTYRLEEIKEEPAPVEQTQEPVAPIEEADNGYRRHDYMNLFSLDNPNVFGGEDRSDVVSGGRFESREEVSNDRINDRIFEERTDREDRTPLRDGLNLFEEKPEDNPYTLRSEFEETKQPTEDRYTPERSLNLDFTDKGRAVDDALPFERGFESEIRESRVEPVVEPPKPSKPRVIKPYKRISLDDLDCRDIEPTANQEEIERTKETIIATLEDFNISGATIASVTFGPTVTRYNVAIPKNILPKKVVALDQSISINLYSDGVNIYPNYEDGAVSIEVPNKERQFVQLGCMLSGDTYVNAKSSSLVFAMGKDVANRKIYGDVSKMIHLLVAGSSGSGKSVFLGSLIISLIHKYSPEELRLILIDPKKTEFVLYNNLPHLLLDEIITDSGKAVQSLNWAIMEMNRRYGLFEQMSKTQTYVVNLDQYNAQVDKNERLPKIIIIIDELADLMLAAKKEMEEKIQNLTQKARAAGIHLIVATQRPSTDVITGVIKSNLHTRIAFGVATDVDSRVILDQTGAQNLLGKGDFLYTMQGIKTPVRVQSAFISTEESQKVVNYIKENNEAYYDEDISAYINNTRGASSGDGGARFDKDNVEQVYIDALRNAIIVGSASISMIQRKFSAGYNKAGKIIEWMEEMGYISAFDGARARKVLITKEEFEKKYGPF